MIPTRKEHRIPVVYKITNLVNGKIYVGSAVNLYNRYKSYKRRVLKDAPRRMVVEKAMVKYGMENFSFEILERLESKDMTITKEQIWLDILQPFDPIGYNVNKKAESRLGMTVSDSVKIKMSLTRKNRMESGEIKKVFSKKVLKINMNTLKIEDEFCSAKDAARSFGTENSTCISQACNKKQLSAKGFYWCWKRDYEERGFNPTKRKDPSKCKQEPKPVNQLNPDGSLASNWPSIRSASKTLNCSNSQISSRCNGKKDSLYRGFIWKFSNE